MPTVRDLLRRVANPILSRIDSRISRGAAEVFDTRAEPQVDDVEASPEVATAYQVYVPPISWVQTSAKEPFMAHSTCSAADFRHPNYSALCSQFQQEPRFHRKQWEFAFILNHLTEAGMLGESRRGVGFGVGSEPLPAVMASMGCYVLATDAPPEVEAGSGWGVTGQFANSRENLRDNRICADSLFDEMVHHQPVDMNAIPDELTDFDFCWSSCCFEHLGSLKHGAEFVLNSVEKCLRPGGVAVHTSEFNLSSESRTFESEGLSIYRKSDVIDMISLLESRGHQVAKFRVAPDNFYLDHFVDLPPYSHDPHLKLELAGFVTTSFGLVITRGK